MQISPNLWHPAGTARQYEAAGSRSSFSEKWNPQTPHSFDFVESTLDALRLLIDVLTDDQKECWLYSVDPAAEVKAEHQPINGRYH
jgi:hypothetical protein